MVFQVESILRIGGIDRREHSFIVGDPDSSGRYVSPRESFALVIGGYEHGYIFLVNGVVVTENFGHVEWSWTLL